MDTNGVKDQDNGCALVLAWIVGVPVAIGLITTGHGDWIVGAVVVAALIVMVVVTVGEFR